MILAFILLAGQVVQSPSSVSVSAAKNGTKTIGIQNVSFHLWQKMMLKKTTRFKQILGDRGSEGTVMLEAWTLGADMRQKPAYALQATGTDGVIVDYMLFVVSRGLETEDWWSVYKLSNGQRLFDTHVPMVSFSISRETLTTRYVGFEVASDDVKDARLKQPKVIGVLAYASPDRVLHEWILTCDDVKRAQLLRSFADVTRRLGERERQVMLNFRENYPSAASPVDLVMSVRGDDLDVSRLPAAFHLSPWRR